jgi:hypothetical protein
MIAQRTRSKRKSPKLQSPSTPLSGGILDNEAIKDLLIDRKTIAISNPVKIKHKIRDLASKSKMNFTLSSKVDTQDHTSMHNIRTIYGSKIKEIPDPSYRSQYGNMRDYLTNKLRLKRAQMATDSNRTIQNEAEGFNVSLKYCNISIIIL